eukprot:24954-Eustigmatos_ZCMA.PRE.1
MTHPACACRDVSLPAVQGVGHPGPSAVEEPQHDLRDARRKGRGGTAALLALRLPPEPARPHQRCPRYPPQQRDAFMGGEDQVRPGPSARHGQPAVL